MDEIAYLTPEEESALEEVWNNIEEVLSRAVVPDATSVVMGMVGDEWHGPNPPGEGWIAIAPGPKGGKRWRRSKTRGRRTEPRPRPTSAAPTVTPTVTPTRRPVQPRRERQRPEPDIGGEPPDTGGVATDGVEPPVISKPVAEETPRPTDTPISEVREDTDFTPRPEVAQHFSPEAREQYRRTARRLSQYARGFRAAGNEQLADWMESLRTHIKNIGTARALDLLGKEQTTDKQRVAYRGTGYFEEGPETDFIRRYLDHCGIVLHTDTDPPPNLRVIASAPVGGLRPTDFTVTNTPLETKLEEAKLLDYPDSVPTEDINVIVGKNVTKLTNDVLAKLDERYGQGKWIIKSYGDESYAGFGIFFPQRVTAIQQESQQAIAEAEEELNVMGYVLARNADRELVGIRSNTTGGVIAFSSPEFVTLPQEVQRLGKVAQISSHNEQSVTLPGSSEEQLRQVYGILLRRDPNGSIIGITNYDGVDIDFDTPEWENLKQVWRDTGSTAGYEIDRALAWGGVKGNVGYMVQTAYDVVGVSEEDRALGFTWETSNEGRVHIVVQNGRARVIPYATLAGRADALPAVFANEDIRAMEQAAQDAVDALPAELRTGQVYAPDVIKTTDGWKVIELNASVPEAQSAWLESNPMVIDAYVSFITGREPAHVRFVRNMLRQRMLREESPVTRELRPSRKPEKQAPVSVEPVTPAPTPTIRGKSH